MKTLTKLLGIIILFSIVSFMKVSAQNPTFEWAKKIGGSRIDMASYHVTDEQGNIYVTGFFRNTADFDPGLNTRNLTSNGINDIFVAKYDSLGNYQWAHAFGNIYNDNGSAITLDNDGNVIITGYFQSTIDFDPGPAVANLSAVGLAEVFILKLDTNGSYMWAKSFGGVDSETGNAIDTDSLDNILISGKFEGTVDFDPGPSTYNLSSNGNADIYVSKLDKNGNFIWAKQMGGTFNDAGTSISVDPSGFVYTTGYFHGTADFNPDSTVYNLTSNGDNDIFISKLDSNGNFIWAKGIGSIANDVAYSILVDQSKYVYLTGYFRNTVDFDPGPGTVNLVSNGFTDIFILKLDTSANLQWAKGIGGTRGDYGGDVAMDHEGSLYFTSTFQGTVDFNPGTGINNLTPSNPIDPDIAILKIDSNANYLWARNFGSGSSTISMITIDRAKNIVTSGAFINTADFDPGPGTYNLNPSSQDAFLMKLSQCSDNSGTDIIIACSSYTWIDSITYTSNNDSATYTLTNSRGCDSIVHLDLTINQATSSSISDTACERFTWFLNNTTYLSSGSYQDTISNAVGCDSIITLNLHIDSTSSSQQIVSACDSFYWTQTNMLYYHSGLFKDTLVNASNCDSIITLDLTINHSTMSTTNVVACDSFLWQNNNRIYTSSGIYKDTISNSFGCDSIITLDLTINHSSTSTLLVNTCDTYLSPSLKHLWSSSGIYQDTIQALNGCDSILTIDLTILESSYDTISVSSCDTYISPSGKTFTASNTFKDTIINAVGCDSIISINLTIYNTSLTVDSITACNSYTWIDGITYTNSTNNVFDTLQNQNGCDSIVELALTIPTFREVDSVFSCGPYRWINGLTYTQSINLVFDTLSSQNGCDSIVELDLTIPTFDTTIVRNNTTLEVTDSLSTYQWLNCSNGFSILPNDTNQSYTATANGSYAVELTKNNCVDTSRCISVISVGLENRNQNGLENISVYPNPTNQNLTIEDHSNNSDPIVFDFYNAVGQKVKSGQITNGNHTLTLNFPKGVYFLELKKQSEMERIKVIVH